MQLNREESLCAALPFDQGEFISPPVYIAIFIACPEDVVGSRIGTHGSECDGRSKYGYEEAGLCHGSSPF
jgi:hypothetical protein